jgi:hypothetical protein
MFSSRTEPVIGARAEGGVLIGQRRLERRIDAFDVGREREENNLRGAI